MVLLRQLHRWIGLALCLFIAVIGLTGTILQGIMVIYGDTGPQQAPGEPFWVVQMRDLAVTIHTGAFASMPGVYVSLICGLGLLYFAVSGLWMYLDLYRSRAALGRTSFFWRTRLGTDATMRSLHRWLCAPLAIFALLIAATGGILDITFIKSGMVPLPPPRHQAGAAFAPPPGGGPPEARPWHDNSLYLHKLDFLGASGHILAVLVGVSLVTMAITGLWIYVSIHARRRKAGLPGLFW